ncbi:hypothetical protein BCON_0034g00620 [Botryotinia convoluta]|uniref:Uncharacterized protein n=1 Tax=Botryotinia convoluta TaxID=54673 RepID=A0A4Z1IH02_9HELO|nr:hypothetical protein BCON_0034g00620 [Botryotinia convoluta]
MPNIIEGARKTDEEPCFEPMFSKTGAYFILELKSRHARLPPGVLMDPSSDGMRLQFQVPFFIAPRSEGDKVFKEGNGILLKLVQ